MVNTADTICCHIRLGTPKILRQMKKMKQEKKKSMSYLLYNERFTLSFIPKLVEVDHTKDKEGEKIKQSRTTYTSELRTT